MAKIYIKFNVQGHAHISCFSKRINPCDSLAVKFFAFECILKGELGGLEFLEISSGAEYVHQNKI